MVAGKGAGPELTGAIETPRLVLVPASVAALEAELGGRDALAAHLGAEVPGTWPPGEHDEGAVRFFLGRLREQGVGESPWWAWYAIERDPGGAPARLAGSAGFMGPPRDGEVEVGCSLVEDARGRGLATEMVHALAARAFGEPGVGAIVAEAREDNAPSNGVLVRCGFEPAGPGREPGLRRWRLPATPAAAPAPREAAVLVPLWRDARGAWRLVVVRRTEHGIHGGQLAFPGGSRTAGDASLEATALREAFEETGLAPASVRLLAGLPRVETRVSNFVIAPFLAVVERPRAWEPEPREIAEVLEPALATLLAPGARAHADDLMPAGRPALRLPYYAIGAHRLWGASERILTPLLARIARDEWPELCA